MAVLNDLLALAQALGCPRDQIENFLRAGYVPQPKQLEFHAACRECDRDEGPDQVGFGGARGPGKSHASFAQIALDDCQRYPGLKVLYLRKVSKNAKEQFNDLRLSVLSRVKHHYAESKGILTFPNGSRIILGGFKDQKDIDKYLGIEYDIILIEETTTLDAVKYQALRDSNRSSKFGWRPRIYNTTNPGNIGHLWYKKRFIDPQRRGENTYTRFIPATIDDNAFINKDYRRTLEENTGWRLRAYRYGDWDIAAGQYFSTWRHETHVIKPFPIPDSFPIFGGFDYGFTHPTSFNLLTQDGDGNIYVIGEHRRSRAQASQQAEDIKRLVSAFGRSIEECYPIAAGADCWAKKTEKETIAETYANLGINLQPANVDRVNGAAKLLDLLGDPAEGITPKLFIFNTCSHLIETIPYLLHNPNRPEDVLKVDVDENGIGGDDPYDSLRYGIMSAPGIPTASTAIPAGDPLQNYDKSRF